MKGAVICQKGIEDLVVKEALSLVGSKGEAHEGYVILEVKDVKDLMKLCYSSQLAIKVLLLLSEFEFDKIQDISKKLKGLKIPKQITNANTFAVRSEGEDSMEIEEQVGAVVFEGVKVNLENPDVILFVYLNEGKGIAGIDFAGIDLSKREYKIYQTRQGLKATTCKALVDIGEYTSGNIVNIECGEGLIGIEAACKLTGKSVHFYSKDKFQFRKMFDLNWEEFFSKLDEEKTFEGSINLYDEQFKHVDNAKKNAKIAGVHKLINFSRLAVEWMDTKFDKQTVDLVVGYPMQESKIVPESKVKPLYKEIFYQCKFVLKSKGKLVLLMRKPGKLDSFAELEGFKLVEQREIWQGKDKLYIEVFSL